MDVQEIKNELSRIEKLPSFPKILPEIIRLSREPLSGMKDYEKVISRDPALAAQVLKIANSPFYGLNRKVSNLRVALTMLGVDEIYRIVLNASFYKAFYAVFSNVSYDFNIFWKHCQLTANAADFFADKFYGQFQGEAYAAGLLHDVGKLVMEQYFQSQWEQVLISFNNNNEEFLSAEERIFGMTHADIGAILMKQWRLPDEIVMPIKYHHNPLLTPSHHILVNVVYFADKTSTACMDNPMENVTREYLKRDHIWERMVTRYPHFNFIEKEKVLSGIKEYITREMPLGL